MNTFTNLFYTSLSRQNRLYLPLYLLRPCFYDSTYLSKEEDRIANLSVCCTAFRPSSGFLFDWFLSFTNGTFWKKLILLNKISHVPEIHLAISGTGVSVLLTYCTKPKLLNLSRRLSILITKMWLSRLCFRPLQSPLQGFPIWQHLGTRTSHTFWKPKKKVQLGFSCHQK